MVTFDLPAPPALIALQLAARGVEGVTHCHVWIFVSRVGEMRMPDEDVLVGHRDVDSHGMQRALLLVPSGTLDPDPAAYDVRAESLEPPGELADATAQRC
jgi:hypothetical protein